MNDVYSPEGHVLSQEPILLYKILYWFSWLFLVYRIVFIPLFLSKTGLPFIRLHYSAFKIFPLVFYLVLLSYLLQVPHPFQICITYTQSVSPTPRAESPQQRCAPLHSRVHILSGKTQKHRMLFHLGNKVYSFNYSANKIWVKVVKNGRGTIIKEKN